VLGEKSEWSENPRKWLTEIAITFSEWYNDDDKLTWWATDDRYNDIKETDEDEIGDIGFGNEVYNDNRYMNPCSIYTTPNFWGVVFYDNSIVCGKNGKTLQDLSKEVKQKKEKYIKQQEEISKEREKSLNSIYEKDYAKYIQSDSSDKPELKHLSKYKGKVVEVTINWKGYDDKYTFIGILTTLYKDFDPSIVLPLTNDMKVIKSINNYYHYDGPKDYIKHTSTNSAIYNMTPFIITDIKLVDDKTRKKYFDIVGKEIKDIDNGCWYKVVYNHVIGNE
jgi:hypothetical protein